jgi:hypothetical protein
MYIGRYFADRHAIHKERERERERDRERDYIT